MPVDAGGTNEDSSRTFSTHIRVTLDPNGLPCVRVDPQGNAVSTPLGTIGGGTSNAVNTVSPSISGTRGGTLTATPGTWTGATSVSGQWYTDGVATGNTTTSFTDSDTSKSLEYRETALPGNVVASGYRGAAYDPPGYSETFDSYADGTWLATTLNGIATPTPHVLGWDAVGYAGDGTLADGQKPNAEALRVMGGKIQQNRPAGVTGHVLVLHDFGNASGIFDLTLNFSSDGSLIQRRSFWVSGGDGPVGIKLYVQKYQFGSFIQIAPTGGTPAMVQINTTWTDGDVLRVKVDAVGKRIYLFQNGAVLGNSAGYDMSTWAGTWTSKAGFHSIEDSSTPAQGENLFNALSFISATANSISTAAINQQSGGSPWQKQINVTASINAVGATGAQFKVETEAEQLVQNWTAMTFASGTATGSCLLGDHAFEGQKFRILVRNVGGTLNTASALTATNGYVLQQQMLVGMNDSDWTYWGGQTIGRDAFEILSGTAGIGIIAANPTTADRQGLMRPGLTQHNYNGWAEAYNASLNYPVTTGSDDHNHCRYQGLSWQTTDNTSKVRSAPNTANTSGAGGDWKLASDCADASLVGLTADGVPTKLPDDPNLTIYFEYLWYVPKGRAPFTVACKTQPGIAVKLFTASLGTVTLTQSSADIAAGQFTLSFSAAAETTGINGMLYIDRTNSTAALNSSFFLSGIPSYETGTPSADIGAPYASVDKLSDLDAFAGIRYVKGAPIERSAGNWAGTMTAANNTVSGVCRQWKYMIDTAQRLGHKYIKLHVPDIADTSYMTAQATFFRDYCDPTIKIHVARSNEDWNPALYQNAVDLHAAAVAAGISDIQMYARKFNAMVAVWKSVFGAAYDSRVVSVFEWQAPTSTTTWAEGLDFENCYQNVGALSIAPYFEGGIGGYNIAAYSSTPDTASAQDLVQNAVAASDQTAFNNALDTRLTKAIDASVAVCAALYAWLPGYSISKGLSPNAIGLEYYEGGQHIAMTSTNLAAWDSGIGAGAGARAASYFKAYKRSAKMGAKTAYYIDQLAQKAPGILNFFCYAGGVDVNTGTGWGSEDTTGNVTQEPFATLKTKALAYNV
jgi:hypothetical protein